jgi:predicted DNA-binding transcriptional regulator YafY
VVERGFASMRYLVRDVLKEAGDAVVLEPADARAAVREAAEALRGAVAPVAAR